MRTHAQWLADEPFTLALGAGFFGFFAHVGLLEALEERGLYPARVVGVSAGALAGGLWSSGVPAPALGEELGALRREDFWDPGLPLGGLLRGRKFADKLREVLAVDSFGQCRWPFAAVVHDVFRRRTVVLDEGPMELAIRASCTVPLMFRPVVARRRVLVDGGVSDRWGRAAIRSDERVLLHFLPSRRKVRWRTPEPAPTRSALPGREGVVLLTPDLPSVGPFQLDAGPVARQTAREHVRRWLDQSHEPSPARA